MIQSINQYTLIYGILTLMRSLVYLGCVIVSRALIAPLTSSSELSIMASTLAIAALFNPLRQRIQKLIDKRFYRHKWTRQGTCAVQYDVRDETDLNQLTTAMLRVMDETTEPDFV